MNLILEVNNLTKIYGQGCPHCYELTGPECETNICSNCGTVVAIYNISFNLYEGEILGIIGESGSGKSTIVKNLYFDQAPTSGEAFFFDSEHKIHLFELDAARKRWFRNHYFGMVYQNPQLGLNLNISAGGNIADRLLMSGFDGFAEIREKAKSLLLRMEVLPSRMDEFPRYFSGGMQQRVQIAKALAPQPALLFLDEVTTGLDLSVQAGILDLILEIQQELQTAMIVVTHDLGVVRMLTNRTMVMKYGRIVEFGLTDQILEDPQHEFTQRLVSSAL